MQKNLLKAGFIILAAGLIITAILVYRHKVFTQDRPIQKTSNSRTMFLPLSFREPMKDGAPHIVGAQIEHIDVKDCEYCDIDIFTKIDGVSDADVATINTIITHSVFNGTDVRIPKNRVISDPELSSVDSMETKILYVDKGVIEWYSQFEGYYKEAAHNTRNMGSYTLLNVNNFSDRPFLLDADYPYENKDKVLNHFYPNGKELFEPYKAEDQEFPDEHNCYETYSFPEDFWPEFRPGTGELIYLIPFPYASTGPCSPGLEIAIPVNDILTQVPELVPKESILWKFKK
jgi:hypothetical protein